MANITKLVEHAEALFRELDGLPLGLRVEAINRIRRHLHKHSPFADEPVDCVQWIPGDRIEGNDYNPNTVAPPEMKLLARSIEADGFTQPIVAHQEAEERYVIVDGFHRQRVGWQPGIIRQRLHGHLPVVSIRAARENQADRIAATIRHNRARGIHGVLPMIDIVVMLRRAGWNDIDVARELGMDADEVLRFKQVSGLPELFRDHQYSPSWD